MVIRLCSCYHLLELKDSLPEWISKLQYYCDRYAGKLERLYGLSEKDVAVYMYMFTQTLFFKNSNFIPNQISSELNKVNNEFVPNESNSRYNPRDVKSSLDRLESLGFVGKVPNFVRDANGGAPGKFIYSTKKIVELDEFTQDRLDRTRGEMLNLLQDLEQVQDAVDWGANVSDSK